MDGKFSVILWHRKINVCIAMSLVHGGPGPKCFGQPLYDAVTKGVMHDAMTKGVMF